MGATSEHFSDAELQCHCGCGVNDCTQALVEVLEAFRAVVGQPVTVDDAYRCPAHNAAIHGASHSEHVQGIAADITVADKTAVELEAIAKTIPAIHGIGRDDFRNYVHIDTRPTSVEWCYNRAGAWVHYFPPLEPSAPINA